jgi:hypothetical protein
VKITANTTVIIIPRSVPRRLPSINEWCAYVTLAPDESSKIVLSNGISNVPLFLRKYANIVEDKTISSILNIAK